MDRKLKVLTLGCLVVGTVGGCSCDEAVIGLQGALEVDPPAVDFGKVPVGGEGRQMLTLRNTGTFVLTIQGVEVGAPFVVPTSTASLAPGRSTEVELRFRPTAVGRALDTLRIVTDDPDAPVTEVALEAEGIAAAVNVEPFTVDFGEVLWVTDTERQTREVTVTNPGSDSFDLTAVEIVDDAGGAFAVAPGESIRTFGPGDSATFEVSFLPVAMGPAAGTVRIATTVRRAPELVVGLRGVAVGPVMEVCAGPLGNEGCTDAGGTPDVNFGPVPLSTMATGVIRVQNQGTRELTVEGELLGSPGEIAFAPTFMSLGAFTVPAGGEQQIDVTFSPTDYVFDAVNVSLVGNAAQRSSQVVPVRGEVPKPKVEVIPRSINFRVQGGVDMTQAPIKIINCGSLELTLTGAISLNQTQGPGRAFTLMSAPTPGTTIAPSSNCDPTATGPQFMVLFAPSTAGQYSAEVTIMTDDPNEPSVVVTLLGVKS